MYDLPLLHRQMMEILGIRDADKIVPLENDILPTDPVTENMKYAHNEPVKGVYFCTKITRHIYIHIPLEWKIHGDYGG